MVSYICGSGFVRVFFSFPPLDLFHELCDCGDYVISGLACIVVCIWCYNSMSMCCGAWSFVLGGYFLRDQFHNFFWVWSRPGNHVKTLF